MTSADINEVAYRREGDERDAYRCDKRGLFSVEIEAEKIGEEIGVLIVNEDKGNDCDAGGDDADAYPVGFFPPLWLFFDLL